MDSANKQNKNESIQTFLKYVTEKDYSAKEALDLFLICFTDGNHLKVCRMLELLNKWQIK